MPNRSPSERDAVRRSEPGQFAAHPLGADGARTAPAGRRPTIAVVSDDAELLRRLDVLAAAAGAVLVRSSASDRAPAGDLVLLGTDRLPAADGPTGRSPIIARRARVVVVATGDPPPSTWQQALAVGAEHVAVLPEAEAWLLDRLLDAASGRRRARVIGVIGGRGGAGASTLAVALAVTAARDRMRPMLIDLDSLGGGVDLVLGGELESGLRWEDLAAVRGRLQPGLLDAGLPRACGVGFLTFDRVGEFRAGVEAVEAVLDAAGRESSLVVIDLPRQVDDLTRAALRHTGEVLLVVPAEVRAGAAAGRLVAAIEPLCPQVRLVVRGPAPTGLTPQAVADALALPLAADLRAEPGLAGALDQGLAPPVRPRGPLGLLCRRLLSETVEDSGRDGAFEDAGIRPHRRSDERRVAR